MGRYLIFLSYIGTGFCGFQRQGNRPIKTVVGVLEDALSRLRPANEVQVVTSSRTDKGVHALCNTVHVDLHPRSLEESYDTASITRSLNRMFSEFQEDVRILKTVRVADNFHSRFQAVSRTYVYRVCVPQDLQQCTVPFELTRCYRVRRSIDIELMRKAADILSGTHDFRSFTSLSRLLEQSWQNPVKTIEVSVEPGDTFLGRHTSAQFGVQTEYWDLVFKSHSFLYRQVRKMASVMLSVGYGDTSLEELSAMVNSPKNVADFKQQHIFDIPPYGLYLTDVIYKESDMMQSILNTSPSIQNVPEMDRNLN